MLHLPDPIAGWTLDEPFLAEAMRRAELVELVSLDVFDTALTRLVESPVDVFADIERRLLETLGRDGECYAEIREAAERAVHLRRFQTDGAGEITLADILEELIRQRPVLAGHAARLARTEIEAERSVLVAVPDIMELTRRLAAIGKPIIFVSDMYLPAEAIAGFLVHAGYAGWQSLYVSSQTGATKSTGRQWQVLRQAGVPARILHIGDDQHADIDLPRAYGIDTLLYARARSERRYGACLSASVLPFSRANRASALAARTLPGPDRREPAAIWRDQGRVLGAILVGSFLRWLESRVRLHKIDALYFCARDGWMLQRAWRAAGLDRTTGIADHYLHVSRRPLTLACGHAQSRPGWLHPSVLRFLASTDGNTSFGAALGRIGLADEPGILADLRGRGGTLDDRLSWTDGVETFKALLSRHSAVVHERLRESHVQLSAYLTQEQFGAAGRSAIVDIGWHGGMQRSLRRIIEIERGPTTLTGFYYGLWPSARGNRYGAGLMESAFASDFIAAEQQAEIKEAVEILEELHGAPHGTVTSYRQDGDRWNPVFADQPAEIAQYETVTRHFQDGVIETVAELFRSGSSGALRLDALTPEVGRAAIGSISLSPTAEELVRFGGLGHCSLFDHAQFDPLVRADCPAGDAERDHVLRHSFWRLGTLRTWWEHAGEADRPGIGLLAAREFAAAPRVLRRFGQ